jgi:cell division protein FtsI (penicillin-binding protein 3)
MSRRRVGPSGESKKVYVLRRRILLLSLVGAAAMITARAFQVALVEHTEWQRRADSQHADTLHMPAPRGTIYDREGDPLASSREVWMVAVAPREISDPVLVAERLSEQVGLPQRAARRVVTGNQRWVVLPGRYEESTRQALDGLSGVHFGRAMKRFYPHGAMASELLGRVNVSGEVAGGVEQELDSVLAGRDGRAVVRVDSRGRPIPGVMLRIIEPVPGRDVVLTIDADLQEIAGDALIDALETTGAASGEMVIADPATGEILAAVSRRGGRPAGSWTAATAPYEPGSTIKPFTLASLLTERRASLSDSVYGEEGSYRLFGRTINDVQPHGWLTLREGFLVSSNIILAKSASRLDPAQQYRRLRDFGFGAPTGISYPSESGGRLRRPADWSKQSQASLAFGYEISVTPLQLVMAYAAIANGGLLMEPRLVREVRARDGRVDRRIEPFVVRRVMSEQVAAELRDLLVEAVDRGTGRAASLGALKVAGKTGTARFTVAGRYQPGAYVATFAGFFPADDPQLVFLVKLDRPQGDYYGGLTAAPVTKATLQAALAAKGMPFDRRAVAMAPTRALEVARAGEREAPLAVRAVSFAHSVSAAPNADAEGDRPQDQPAQAERQGAVVLGRADRSEPGGVAVVPPVEGLSLRVAVRRLHASGFRVRIEGGGKVVATIPAEGSVVREGALVRLLGGAR